MAGIIAVVIVSFVVGVVYACNIVSVDKEEYFKELEKEMESNEDN